jgi:hypothetical protein
LQNHHIDFGIVCLAEPCRGADSTVLRIRTTSTTATTPKPDTIVPLQVTAKTGLRLEIRADNTTHYTFRYAQNGSEFKLVGYGLSEDVSWGFTGRFPSASASIR